MELVQVPFIGQVQLVKFFCYLENRLNSIDGKKPAMPARTKIEWIENVRSFFWEKSFR